MAPYSVLIMIDNLWQNCGNEGHKAAECTDARAIALSKVPDMSHDDAWVLLEKASADKDLDDFKDVRIPEVFNRRLPTECD